MQEMNIVHIDTLDIPELAPYAKLTERQLQNRLHPDEGLFICESIKVIRIAVEQGVEPVSFLCEEQFLPQVEEIIGHWPVVGGQLPVYTASREVLKQLTGYALSRGVLCAMRRPTLPPVATLLSSLQSPRSPLSSLHSPLSTQRVAVVDSVVNSENTGAIFRAAAALGIDAVLLTHTCCDPLNRRACRVSMGTVFQLPWTFLDSYKQLKDNGFSIVALALSDRSVPIDAPELKSIDKMAIVMGTEGDGLSDSVLCMADHVARIPMQRGVDSLNVAAAAAVAFWQLR